MDLKHNVLLKGGIIMKSLLELIYPNQKIDIDPSSPQKCDCCGRLLKRSDLIHKGRSMVPPSTICRKSREIYDEFFEDCEDPLEASDLMVKKLGEEKATEIQIEVSVAGTSVTGYECKDCAILDDEAHHEKRRARRSEKGLG
jgi:hypothetical protein